MQQKLQMLSEENMSNFPVVSPNFKLLDFGNITCENQNLEKSQQDLAEKVSIILQKNAKSIVLGGGHEVTFLHIIPPSKKHFPTKK